MKTVILTRTFRADSAHRITGLSEAHKCSALHGHSFRIDVSIKGRVDGKIGWLMDFGDIKDTVDPIIQKIDHKYLNEIEGLEKGTSENLVIWLWDRLKPLLPELFEITVWESDNSKCAYRGG
ncbi:6-carboxytetrahydropterin synthase QueD [candidate division WOR-3 bacterium]|nr:6-carboxytetrahydropterin synthase QueD [candidate division WOR-3 bacterium]